MLSKLVLMSWSNCNLLQTSSQARLKEGGYSYVLIPLLWFLGQYFNFHTKNCHFEKFLALHEIWPWSTRHKHTIRLHNFLYGRTDLGHKNLIIILQILSVNQKSCFLSRWVSKKKSIENITCEWAGRNERTLTFGENNVFSHKNRNFFCNKKLEYIQQ